MKTYSELVVQMD